MKTTSTSTAIRIAKRTALTTLRCLGQPWVKVVWFSLCALAAAVAAVFVWPQVRQGLAQNGPLPLGVLGLIMTAKPLNAVSTWFWLRRYTTRFPLPDAIKAYGLAELGKYVPGGVWAYASRLAIYRERGVDMASGAKSLGCETGAQFVAPIVTAGVLMCVMIDWLLTSLALAATLAALLVTRRTLAWFVGSQLAAWTLFGASFAATLMVIHPPLSWPEATAGAAAFDVSFSVGLAAVFAPAGLGVREGVAGWLFAMFSTLDTEVVVAALLLHRAIWTLGDVFMGGVAAALPATPLPSPAHADRPAES